LRIKSNFISVNFLDAFGLFRKDIAVLTITRHCESAPLSGSIFEGCSGWRKGGGKGEKPMILCSRINELVKTKSSNYLIILPKKDNPKIIS